MLRWGYKIKYDNVVSKYWCLYEMLPGFVLLNNHQSHGRKEEAGQDKN